MTIIQSLSAINAYPLSSDVLTNIAESRGLDSSIDITLEIRSSASYNLAKSDVMLWLADAPDVSQGDIDYSFTDDQRARLRSDAKALASHYGEHKPSIYGYKGHRL